jgi:hypothetical protein
MIRSTVAAVLAVGVFAFAASAQPMNNNMHPGPSKNYICPAQVMVKFVPTNPALLAVGGWQANEGPFPVQLDPANPPHLSGGNMTCYYKLLNQPGAFNIYQPVGTQKCSVLSNGTGFVCSL